MVLRALAIELYRAQQHVESLKKQLTICPLQEQDGIARALKVAEAERDRIRNMLEGRKDTPLYRRTFRDR